MSDVWDTGASVEPPLSRVEGALKFYESMCKEPFSDGNHDRLLTLCRAGRNVNLSNNQIVSIMQSNTPFSKHRKIHDSDIYRALGSHSQGKSAGRGGEPVAERTPINMEKIKGIMIDDISIFSYDQDRCPTVQACDFMDTLYHPSEKICVGGFKATKVYKISDCMINTATSKIVPEFVSVNPLRLKRLDVNCTSFRYGVLESDKIPIGDSLKLYAGMIAKGMIKPVTVTLSGSKSVHCIYRTKIKTLDEWHEKLKPFYKDLFHELGFDHCTSNPSRLTRLAGHFRKEKGNLQQLLYINRENGWRYDG